MYSNYHVSFHRQPILKPMQYKIVIVLLQKAPVGKMQTLSLLINLKAIKNFLCLDKITYQKHKILPVKFWAFPRQRKRVDNFPNTEQDTICCES